MRQTSLAFATITVALEFSLVLLCVNVLPSNMVLVHGFSIGGGSNGGGGGGVASYAHSHSNSNLQTTSTTKITCTSTSTSTRCMKKGSLVISSTTSLFGILDDMNMITNSNDQGEEKDTAAAAAAVAVAADGQSDDNNSSYQALFESLIFSSNMRKQIDNKLQACSEPSFLNYLTSALDTSDDVEEQQAYRDLLTSIQEAKQQDADRIEEEELQKTKQLEIEAEEQSNENDNANDNATTASTASTDEKLSNADILRRAGEIDSAIGQSDDESSDFISDCREVVNLSGGFNNRGQMRVGG